MTRITRMEMKGFKSFAQKTELVFGEQFNCVLGPNGSGKSNILDSLCFVLGKSSAKGLRAEKSANLIYNGGKHKKQSSQGEVSIYFDNKRGEFGELGDEIKITRIIKQNGQSIYKLNDKTLTRAQILEALRRARIDPDGHNIVLQGDIVHMAEMTPDERRRVIEEIAGISVYEEKKEKALRELGRVEEKLNEAQIILTERETYLRELKSERDQAAKFKELDEKVKRNKATVICRKIEKKSAEQTKLEGQQKEHREKIAKLEGEIAKLRERVEAHKQKVEQINKEVEEKGEHEQVALHKEVEQLRLDVALNRQRIETLKNEIARVEDRRIELLKTHKDIDAKLKAQEKARAESLKRIEQREREIVQLDERIAGFKRKHKIEDAARIDERIVEIDKEMEKLAEAVAALREEQQSQLREKDRTDVRLSTLDEQISKVKEVAREHKQAIEKLKEKKQNFKQLTKELSRALNESASIEARLTNQRERLLASKEELSRLHARNASIQESAAGSLAVRRILEQRNKIKGIHGSVAELGRVESKVSLALEVAAGARLHCVVVENDKVAEQCINYLKQNRLGVATFLPLNKLNVPAIKQELRKLKSRGLYGLAVDLVSYDAKYAKVFAYVFGNTLIVDDIPAARSLGIGRNRMATLNGELLELSGAMSGGHRSRKEGAGFAEKELTASLHKLEGEVTTLEGSIAKLEEQRSESHELIERLRNSKAELEGEIIKEEKSLFLEGGDLDATADEKRELLANAKRLDARIDEISDEITEKNRDLARLKTEKSSLREQIAGMRNPRVLAELNTFDEKKQDLQREVVELRAEVKSTSSESANILGPELANVQKILKQHDREQAGFVSEQKELEAKIKKQEAELAKKEEVEKRFFAQFKDLFNKRSKLNEEITGYERDISERQDRVRETEHKVNAVNLDVARIKAELAALEEEAKPFEGIEPFKDKADAQITREINEFEKMLSDLGAVNLKALEIYDTAEHEYNELIKKKEKLSHEREDVLVMITEIDTRKKELFMRTYEVVSKNFSAIFSTLSPKGKAEFDLEDSKDPFAGGLTLKVRLTSKKFLDIRSLSGGEKTLTALAFLFAIQEHDPASFYVLDEVDAALDKHNSEKLAGMIRTYADRAQYLMISHNDAIISEADNLYGISMNADGMSKITSLKL